MRGLLSGLIRWTLIAIVAVLVLLALAGAAFLWQAERRETKSPEQAAPIAGRFVRAADVDVFIQEDGPDQGPVVLFVHGTGAWSGAWRRTMTAAAGVGYRAISIDLPPFGFSHRPAQPLYGKLDQGRRIAGVLETLKIPRAILVGHSFGGGPTVEAAFLAPRRVQGMVLVDAALGIRADAEASQVAAPVLRQVLGIKPLRDAAVAAFLTNPRFTRKLLELFIDNPQHATDDWVRIYQRPLVVRGSTAAIGEWLPSLLVPPEAALSEDPVAYKGLHMPVALIWGDRDTITPLEQGKLIAALVPHADLVVMEGVGHIPQIEDGRRFDALLLTMLARLAGTHQ